MAATREEQSTGDDMIALAERGRHPGIDTGHAGLGDVGQADADEQAARAGGDHADIAIGIGGEQQAVVGRRDGAVIGRFAIAVGLDTMDQFGDRAADRGFDGGRRANRHGAFKRFR